MIDTERWLLDNLDFFNPLLVDDNCNQEVSVKCFLELIYLNNMFESNKFIHKQVQEFILSKLEKFSLFAYGIKNPTFSTAGIIELKFLRNTVGENHHLFLKIKNLANKNYYSFSADEPFRILDNMYELYTLGLIDNEKVNISAKDTVLMKKENLLYGSELSAYALTHSIFYATDMGNNKIVFYDENMIKNKLLFLLFTYYLEKHIDLVCEILLCIKFCNFKLSKVEEKLVLGVYKLLDEFKLVQGAILPDGTKGVDKWTKERIFYKCYHVSLVYLGVYRLYEDDR